MLTPKSNVNRPVEVLLNPCVALTRPDTVTSLSAVITTVSPETVAALLISTPVAPLKCTAPVPVMPPATSTPDAVPPSSEIAPPRDIAAGQHTPPGNRH